MKKIRNLLFVVCLLISLGVFTSCKKKVETSGTWLWNCSQRLCRSC